MGPPVTDAAVNGNDRSQPSALVLRHFDRGVAQDLSADGRITVADEIHTPDSSRFWVMDSYHERHDRGDEPESLDKEFLRLWLRDKGISDDNIPTLDDEIRLQVAERYIDLFERVTGQTFSAELDQGPILDSIERSIEDYF